jgi:hypothetical protein
VGQLLKVLDGPLAVREEKTWLTQDRKLTKRVRANGGWAMRERSQRVAEALILGLQGNVCLDADPA